jgi:spore coat protein CotF
MWHTQKLTSSTIIKALGNKLNKKKGKINFANKKQLCYSFCTFLKTKSQGMGKKSTTFWDKVDDHYINHHLTTRAKRIARSLETKLGTIKHNVSKCGKV